tara:strand:+ start:87 stop:464 length:378 start_codon:yes stop_codon:yes gene_type:complete
MGQQSPALELAVWPDIHRYRSGLRPRTTGPLRPSIHPSHIESRGDESGSQLLPSSVVDLGDAIQLFRSPRRPGLWICLSIPSGLKGVNGYLITHDVVWVGIHATGWVSDDDPGPQFADDSDQSTY